MKRSSPAGIGMITILTALLILSLATFSALTLASSGADLRLSRAAAEKTASYYAADAQAAQIYADFAAGSASELETLLTISNTQSLSLRFSRNSDGDAVIDCWRVIVQEEVPDDSLPVWTGK